MTFPKTLAATKAPEITALIDGMSVVGNGFFFTEEMLSNNEAALDAAAAAPDQVAQLTQQLADANAAKKTAEEALATATAQITAKDAEIAQLKTDLAAAEEVAAPFTEATRTADSNGQNGKQPYHLSDKNPANIIADSVMGKPKPKE